MTSRVSAYTPLESLLLFQYLSIHGVNNDAFGKISDLLRNDALVKSSGNYEPGRLSRDALRDFFLRLLKEEARNEIHNSSGPDSDGVQADGQPNSRKRKAPSPHLPTIQEALNDAHLIPQLINKLYARYREHAIIEIREDERRYERLDKDIKEIEQGQWDQKLQQQVDRGEFDEVLKKKQVVNGTVSGQGPKRASPGVATTPPQEELEPHSIQTKLSPIPPQAPSPHPPRAPGQVQLPPSQPVLASQEPRTPQPPASQYGVASPAAHQSPYAQHPPNATSPRPVGQSPGMPPPPLPAPPYSNQPPYGPHNGVRPGPVHSPYAQSGNVPPQAAPSSGYYQSYPNQQPGYFPQPQYPPPVYPSQRGGVQLPPFQVAPQTPPASKQLQARQQSTHGMLKPVPPRPGELASASTAQARSSLTPVEVARLLLTTDSPLGSGRSTPTSTRWKSSSLSGLPAVPKSPTRPRSRSVSPISDAEGTPDQSPPTVKPNTRRTRSGQVSATRSISATEAPGAGRSTRAQARRARGGSTTSSVVGSSVRGRTRSQSIMSHASMDNESLTGRKVKHEPSTPMEITETVEGTPGSSGQPATRRSMFAVASNKRKRELRGTSEASDAMEIHRRAPSTPKDKVLAVRNFPRVAMPIIENDIMAHKHASLFSVPVRDKDAHGYSDMIRRPQDMKSIKAAITAGSRAVNAATAADESLQSGGPRDASSVLLPVSEDLVPPKGIVNSAQLEREIMRMFANAVMFNPGEDDVVQDAREMYESAAVSMANFRSAERTSAAEAERRRVEESEVDELAPEDDGASATGGAEKNKRRRLG